MDSNNIYGCTVFNYLGVMSFAFGFQSRSHVSEQNTKIHYAIGTYEPGYG